MIDYNLSKEGFDVFSALDGEEGLALVKKEVPDLVFLDLMFPGSDGIEICRKLRHIEYQRSVELEYKRVISL